MISIIWNGCRSTESKPNALDMNRLGTLADPRVPPSPHGLLFSTDFACCYAPIARSLIAPFTTFPKRDVSVRKGGRVKIGRLIRNDLPQPKRHDRTVFCIRIFSK